MAIRNLVDEYDKDLRNQRLKVYEDLWQQLQLLARYDQPRPLTPSALKELSAAMGDWYFKNKGGIYLTDDSRPAYFDLKKKIEAILERSGGQLDQPVDPGENSSLVDLASRLRTSMATDLGARKSTFASVAQADPSNIQEVAASQLELINNYYSTILNQAVQSFRWAIITAGAGFAFFVAAITFLLLSQPTNLSVVSIISGALVEVISGINFYLYRQALGQLELFHVRLERTQLFLLANSVCENLKGDFQQNARTELIRTIASTAESVFAAAGSAQPLPASPTSPLPVNPVQPIPANVKAN